MDVGARDVVDSFIIARIQVFEKLEFLRKSSTEVSN
jgi:hypothetical protein